MIELDLDAVMQPELTSINRLPMRGPLRPTEDEGQCLRQTLDGVWKFHLAEKPSMTPDRWQILDLSDPFWRDINVPGVWTRQNTGDLPIYTNVLMPFSEPHEVGSVPEDNPTGLYRTEFNISENWLEQDVVLHVGGFETLALVWCNGKFAGMATDSRLPSEFLLNSRLEAGLNQLAIMVIKWSDASWIEDQDHWRHGGLHRSVFIEARSKTRIDDLNIEADYDPESGKGNFKCRAKIEGQIEGKSVRCRIIDANGKPVAKCEPASVAGFPHDGSLMDQLQTTYSYPGQYAEISAEIDNVAPWSAEVPNLYQLITELLDSDGTISETQVSNVGFRRVEVQERRLLVNGQPIIIFGVNRHDHHPENGKTVSFEDMRADLISMKQHNVNAVRTAHYPNDHRLLNLADELGLYIVGEANVECHARAKAVANDPRFQKTIVERTMRMIMRDRNHPSIIGWSIGNEAGHGPAHNAAASLARRLDPTRFVQYEGAVMNRFISFWSDPSELSQNPPEWAERNCTDIVCPMYPPIDLIVNWARWAEETKLDDRPLIMCEYSHAMGNSNGSLSEYVDAFYAEPALAGGFVWEWKDHGLAEHDKNGKFYWAYGGHFGEERHDGNFCCDGLVGPDGIPHPGLIEYMRAARPIAMEEMEGSRVFFANRRSFSSTSDLALNWSLLRDGEMLENGMLDLDIAAGARLEVDIPFSIQIDDQHEYVVTLEWRLKADQSWADAGHLASWDQAVLSEQRQTEPTKLAAIASDRSLEAETISAGPIEIDLGQDGVIQSVRLNGESTIESDVTASLWRAPTDNDGVQTMGEDEVMPGRWKPWLDMGLDQLSIDQPRGSVDKFEDKKILSLERNWKNAEGVAANHLSRWILDDNGATVHEQIIVPPEWDDIPRVGIRFTLPSGFEKLNWYGLGPEESYSDRYKSQILGRWQSTVDEQYHLYCYPQEHGCHHNTRSFSLTDENDKGFEILLPHHSSFSARHHHDADLTTATTLADLIRRDDIEVHIDAAMRGVGTGACGPDTLPPYHVGAGTYNFTWIIRAI